MKANTSASPSFEYPTMSANRMAIITCLCGRHEPASALPPTPGCDIRRPNRCCSLLSPPRIARGDGDGLRVGEESRGKPAAWSVRSTDRRRPGGNAAPPMGVGAATARDELARPAMALDRLLCPADGALGLAPGAGDGVVAAGFKPSSVTRPEEVWKLAAPASDEMLLAAEPLPERARKAFLAASGER